MEATEKLGGMENLYRVYAYLDTTYKVIKQHKVNYNTYDEELVERNFTQYDNSSDVKSFRNRWKDIPFEPIWYEYQRKQRHKK